MTADPTRDANPNLYDLVEEGGGVHTADSFVLVELYRDLRFAINDLDLPDGWTVVVDDQGAAYPHVAQVVAWLTSIDPAYDAPTVDPDL